MGENAGISGIKRGNILKTKLMNLQQAVSRWRNYFLSY
jgi:hypothetical protein